MAKVGAFAGGVTRTWTVGSDEDGGSRDVVVLNHHTVAGSRVVSVNGQEVDGTEGSNTLLHGPTDIGPFDLRGGRKAVLHIEAKGAAFAYSLLVDGEAVKEENEIVSGGSSDPAAPKFEVDVPGTLVGVDEKGEKVVWYNIVTTKTEPSGKVRTVTCARRFRDFVAVDAQVKSSYKGSHLMSSLPKGPARGLKFMSDHFSESFIEDRRASLETFLRALRSVPRAYKNSDLLNFLGVLDTTRETSVLCREGPLGVTIHPDRGWVVLADFKPLPDGGVGPPERSGRVAIGDRISKINGESVLGWTYDQVIGKIKESKRPVMLHFLGYYPLAVSRPEGEDGAGESGSGGAAAAAGAAAGAGEEGAAAGADDVGGEPGSFAGDGGDDAAASSAAGDAGAVGAGGDAGAVGAGGDSAAAAVGGSASEEEGETIDLSA